MTEIIGVRFRRSAKVYYFDPAEMEFQRDEAVIVETVRGVELGHVSIENMDLPEEMIPKALSKVKRKADEADIRTHEENHRKAKDAFEICRLKIEEHKLQMTLAEAEYTFDNNKLIFYFTSDGRVDFRNLVRDLAQVFRTRIELRQIGERDQAKMIGGIGSCGQVICCHRFLDDFAPVSIKMAKTQGLSLNPTKISGLCGRLMCCLNYEQEVYKENTKLVPDFGTLVMTEEGQGYVVDRDVLQKRVRVHIYKDDQTEDQGTFDVDDIEVLETRKKGQRRPELRTDLKGGEYSAEKAEEMRLKRQERLERKPRIQQKKNLLAQEEWESIFDDDAEEDSGVNRNTAGAGTPSRQARDDSRFGEQAGQSRDDSNRQGRNDRNRKKKFDKHRPQKPNPQKNNAHKQRPPRDEASAGFANGNAPAKSNCANCTKHDDPIDKAVVVADSADFVKEIDYDQLPPSPLRNDRVRSKSNRRRGGRRK